MALTQRNTGNFALPRVAGEHVRLKCPKCGKIHNRVYKDYDGGFGTCVNCPDTMLKQAYKVQDEVRLAAKQARIRAELNGIRVTRSSNGRVIA